MLFFQLKLGLQVTDSKLVALKWFKHSTNPELRCLAILFHNGMLQLMRNEHDENPIVINTELKPEDCQWNHDGTILAIAGRSASESPGPNQNAIHFYSAIGTRIRTMKLPGNQVSGIAWEGFSLRLAFAIDSYIYLAQVKHDYLWTSFSNTLVYNFHKKNKPESYVMFWDTKNNEVRANKILSCSFRFTIISIVPFICFQRYVKQVRQFIGVASYGDHCVLATRLDDEEIQNNTQCNFGLILCNALGTPVDSKYINLEPRLVSMTATHVITASDTSFILWPYRTPRSQTTLDIASKTHLFFLVKLI